MQSYLHLPASLAWYPRLLVTALPLHRCSSPLCRAVPHEGRHQDVPDLGGRGLGGGERPGHGERLGGGRRGGRRSEKQLPGGWKQVDNLAMVSDWEKRGWARSVMHTWALVKG